MLVDIMPLELADPVDETSDLAEVALCPSRIEADLARSALTAAGIEFFIAGEEIGAYGPVTAFTRGIPILVRRADAEDARAILSSPAASEAEEGEA
jgi:hypothetical protein